MLSGFTPNPIDDGRPSPVLDLHELSLGELAHLTHMLLDAQLTAGTAEDSGGIPSMWYELCLLRIEARMAFLVKYFETAG